MACGINTLSFLLVFVLFTVSVLNHVHSLATHNSRVEASKSLLDLTSSEVSEEGIVSHLEGVSNREKREVSDSEEGCRNCAEKKATLSSQQQRHERIELAKQQILQKLRMNSPPNPDSPKPDLLPLLMASNMIGNETESEEMESKDDFYSKTQNVIVISQNKNHSCVGISSHPCIRFQYQVPDTFDSRTMTSAELWMYKTNVTEAVEVVEFVFELQEEEIISIRQQIVKRNDSDSSWVTFDVTASIEKWLSISTFSQRHLTWDVEVESDSFEFRSDIESDHPISLEENSKPFLIIHTNNENLSTRNRRSVDCSESNTSCCREHFYLSFEEIGWNNWILYPAGYLANYCRGSCRNDISLARHPHTNFVYEYITRHHSEAENMGLKLCCTPSQMSSISFFYLDENGLIFQKNLPNMVVDTCDCA